MSLRLLGAAVVAVVVVVVLAARAHAQREDGWDVRIPDKLELVAGASGTLAIALAVDRGLTISKDAGVYIDLAPTGVAIKRRRWQRADAVDPGADEPRFTIPVHADAPAADASPASPASPASIAVHVRFWVCGSKVCRPVDVKRSVAVAIAAAPEPPPIDAGVPDAPVPPDAAPPRAHRR